MAFERLQPPPSTVKLVSNEYDGNKEIDNSRADAIWKKWISNASALLNFLRGARFIEESISLDGAKAGGINDPTWRKVTDDGAGSTGVFAWAFSPASERELFFTYHFGQFYTENTNITFHLHWMPSDLTLGNIMWGVEYAWANLDGSPGNSQSIEVTVAAGSQTHQEADFAEISGAGKTRQSILIGRIYRKAADAADTYASDAFASMIGISTSVTIDN